MGAQLIKRRRLLGIWYDKALRRCAVACAYVARSPPTGASFPAALGGIQCSIGRIYCTLRAEHMHCNRLPRKSALRNAYFGMHGSGELRHGELLEKEVVFCKVPRKFCTTKSLITLETTRPISLPFWP